MISIISKYACHEFSPKSTIACIQFSLISPPFSIPRNLSSNTRELRMIMDLD